MVDAEEVADYVQQATADGSCTNAVLDNRTGLLLEPCGLRAAAMFNDKFMLVNHSAPSGSAVALNEGAIAWATDGDIFRNSPSVEAGMFSPQVECVSSFVD